MRSSVEGASLVIWAEEWWIVAMIAFAFVQIGFDQEAINEKVELDCFHCPVMSLPS